MNKLLLILFIICTTLIISCDKEKRQKERLDGKWIYEKAKWQEKTFKRKDILDTYRYLDVYFTKEGNLTFIDVKDSIVLLGTYSLDEETSTTYVDENGTAIPITKTQMLVSYTDTVSKKQYQELWDIVRIGKNKIRYETELDGKKAYFTLRRQLL